MTDLTDDLPTTGVHAGRRPAPTFTELVALLLLVVACGSAIGALLALLTR